MIVVKVTVSKGIGDALLKVPQFYMYEYHGSGVVGLRCCRDVACHSRYANWQVAM